jgi:hypothetical protein
VKHYYVGCRCSFSEMSKIAGANVPRLNQKMSETIRKIAMDLGIKKNTKDGGRLEFYSVDADTFATITAPKMSTFVALKADTDYRPLIAVDRDLMVSAIQTVNSQFTGRMDYDTHNKYLVALKQAVSSAVVKLQDDKVAERKLQPKLGANPYKVGDLIVCDDYRWKSDWRKRYTNTRVAKVTKAYVWLEQLHLKAHKVWSNTESALLHFKNVEAYGNSGGWHDHGHFIPFNANAEHMEWRPEMVKHRWDKIARYDLKDLNIVNDAEVGYCYGYEARD